MNYLSHLWSNLCGWTEMGTWQWIHFNGNGDNQLDDCCVSFSFVRAIFGTKPIIQLNNDHWH